MRPLIIFGVVLALIGLITLAAPAFTTTHTKDVAKLGDFKVQEKEQETHFIPPLASGGLLILGVVLIGAGAFGKR